MIPKIDPTNQKNVVETNWNGIYEQVNLNLDGSNNEVAIKQLNGRQGDNNRPVNIQLVRDAGNGNNDVIPYNYGALYPQIVGKDAEDNVIEFGDEWNAEDPQAGFLNINVPAPVYAAVGLTKNMYLRMIDTDGTVVSSVPIVFESVQDAAKMAPAKAQDYMQTVDKMIEIVKNAISPLEALLESYKLAADGADTDLKALLKLIQDNGVGELVKDQTWTGKNTFTDVLTAQVVDILGGLNVNGFDIAKLVDFYKTFSDSGWTRDDTTWLNGATPWSGTKGFWMRQITLGEVHLNIILLACWLPDGGNDVPVVAMPAGMVGDVNVNNYFRVPVWGSINGVPTIFGAAINAANQLVVSATGGKKMGVNGAMIFTN